MIHMLKGLKNKKKRESSGGARMTSLAPVLGKGSAPHHLKTKNDVFFIISGKKKLNISKVIVRPPSLCFGLKDT